jgi:hypothetical protein
VETMLVLAMCNWVCGFCRLDSIQTGDPICQVC